MSADISERCYPLNADSPHVAYLRNSKDVVRFFLIDVTGQSADHLTSLVQTAVADMKSRNAVPVFVTDLTDFSVFRQFGVIFEVVPDIVANHKLVPHLDWTERRDSVLSLIKEKWQPSGQMDLSMAPNISPVATI